nr:dockerin type I repeat-containing protein [Clostridia bacterium]
VGCVNEGEVIGGRYSVGGIVGRGALVTVVNCSNMGTLTALQNRGQVGGIIGELVSGNSTLIDCHNEGLLKGGSSVADLVGIVNIKDGNTLIFLGGSANGTVDCPVTPADAFYGTLKTGNVEKHVMGDIDGDGNLTVADALTLLKTVVNHQTIKNGDVNGDGKVGLADVIRVLKLISQ